MLEAELQRYRHADPAFAIDLPAWFELADAGGALLVALAPPAASPFRANVTVAAQELPIGVELDAYTSAGLASAAERFPAWRLIDRAETAVGALPASRTLATYRAAFEGGWVISVTLEQWVVVHDGLAWIVSCSCDSGDYADACELWLECAESLRPGEVAG